MRSVKTAAGGAVCESACVSEVNTCRDGRETFHRHQLRPVRLSGQHDTGTDGFSVHQNCAGTAYTMLASHVRAGKTEVLSQEVYEGFTHFRVTFVLRPVDAQLDSSSCCHLISL